MTWVRGTVWTLLFIAGVTGSIALAVYVSIWLMPAAMIGAGVLLGNLAWRWFGAPEHSKTTEGERDVTQAIEETPAAPAPRWLLPRL